MSSSPIEIAADNFLSEFYSHFIFWINVVLGINWLRVLYPITWDFKYMHTSFVFQGSKVTSHGIPKFSSLMPSKIFETSVEKGNQSVFMN